MQRSILSIAVGMCCSLAQPCLPATIGSFVTKQGTVVIVLNGPIALGDNDQVERIIKTTNNSGKLVSAIRLNSPGGNLSEGASLADSVRFAKIATVVPKDASCASACFLLFAAGSKKYASYSASIGVHGASDENGQETVDSNAATVGMAKAAKILGVPADIIGRMVVTPPDRIIWLDPNDLRSMGAIMTGQPSQTPVVTNNPPPDQSAQSQEQTATQAGPSASQASTQPPPTWNEVLQKAIATSSNQHDGRPLFNRTCQPEYKLCSMAIFYRDNRGKDTMLRVIADPDGKTLTREVCIFNDFGDVRDCFNWDTGATHKDMKDNAGNWSQIN